MPGHSSGAPRRGNRRLRERRTIWALKRYGLPPVYWHGMRTGPAGPAPPPLPACRLLRRPGHLSASADV
ncbi:hypothetical protein DD630_26530 [Streptomyces sp. BSE7F]|nr:hypothetical protein DD630_26530 [Streptomyces sp. BSE7F]